MLAKSTLLRYNNYSDRKRVIICVLKGILDVCFSVKSTHSENRTAVRFFLYLCGFAVIFNHKKIMFKNKKITLKFGRKSTRKSTRKKAG